MGAEASDNSKDLDHHLVGLISPLWSEIERVKKESPSFTIRFWGDADERPTEMPGYRIGDFAQFHFEADRDCFVTIFDFTTSGSIHILYPNSFTKDNKVIGGRQYTFPDDQAGFKIRVKGPPGIEPLKLFATTKNIPLSKRTTRRNPSVR